MAASETEDSDILWCINHDSFPFKKPLMETQVGTLRNNEFINTVVVSSLVAPLYYGLFIHDTLVYRNPTICLFFFCTLLQMMSNVDGHSWALCALNEERPIKISSPLNKEQIPITDSPVVVQQHNIPPQKFVLLSAKVKTAVKTRHMPSAQSFITVTKLKRLMLHTKLTPFYPVGESYLPKTAASRPAPSPVGELRRRRKWRRWTLLQAAQGTKLDIRCLHIL